MDDKRGSDTQELKNLEQSLDDLSFGLEHILREVGQVYEAIKELKRDKEFEDLADNLSEFAADLLIGGYPLEIMDGDASFVPLKWINSVFDGLKKKLGDKKVYVISVMGIQSSGKSTLLNTMFGLNFSVSAGRCTKGVFAQLISVDEKISDEYGYDYILVLDTEGLRAMELASLKQQRDNELASFTIGIGAITIVNIKGENIAEIGEILQICVHCFLRMRLANNSINLQPGCHFAHQNVSDVNAQSKMLYGVKKVKDQLDTIAKAAAKHENVAQINSFNDVIEFDINKQIWYFPNLWIGDPPMAPANPGYSDTVLKLKSDVLKYPKKERSLTLSKLQERMGDLWQAILNENFVFSFKNSLEVRSYSLLEEKILKVGREFNSNVKTRTNEYYNQIESCERDFDLIRKRIVSELKKYIGELHSSYKKDFDAYFLTAADKDIINQWKTFAITKLEEIVVTLRSDEINNITTSLDLREANYKNLQKLDMYKDDIEKLVKEFVDNNMSAHISKMSIDSMSEEAKMNVINELFETKWNDFMARLDFVQMKKEKVIHSEVWTYLRDQYKAHIAIFESHTKTKGEINDNDYEMNTNFIKRKVGEAIWKKHYENERISIRNEIERLSHKIERDIDEYLDKIRECDYHINYLYEIKDIFENRLADFNKQQSKFQLSIVFEVKMFTHYLKKAIPRFERMQKDYREKNDQRKMVNKIYKPKTHAIFIGIYTRCKKENTASKMLGDTLESALIRSLNKPLSQKMYEICKDKEEFDTKLKLIKKVMHDLKTEKNFDKYIAYIKDTQKALEEWIEKYVTTYCIEETDGQTKLGKEAKKIFEKKVRSLQECIDEVEWNDKCTFQKWLNQFNNAAKSIIPLSDSFLNLFGLKEVEVTDIEYFKKELKENLCKIQKENVNKLIVWGINELKNLKEKPNLTISKNILGCMKQCPFCNVICTWTLAHPDKDHKAPRHYPSGINGYHYSSSKELAMESCNEDIASERTFIHPNDLENRVQYKVYRIVNDYYNSWNIEGDVSYDAVVYWKWVFAYFSDKFAKYYKLKCNNIPQEWNDLDEDYVDKSIDSML